MTTKEWVGLAVRVIGFWVMVHAVIGLLDSVPYLHKTEALSAWSVFLTLWPGRMTLLIAGGWMLFWPGGIVRLVCGEANRGRQGG
jgi:hypothetical protein